jgi:ribosome recycling factor
MDQQQEQMAQMIQNLREDLKEIRVETRQDIKDLEEKTETWHDEVRGEFTDVKKRLDTIETQISTKADLKKASWDKVLSVIAIIVAISTAVVLYIHK